MISERCLFLFLRLWLNAAKLWRLSIDQHHKPALVGHGNRDPVDGGGGESGTKRTCPLQWSLTNLSLEIMKQIFHWLLWFPINRLQNRCSNLVRDRVKTRLSRWDFCHQGAKRPKREADRSLQCNSNVCQNSYPSAFEPHTLYSFILRSLSTLGPLRYGKQILRLQYL